MGGFEDDVWWFYMHSVGGKRMYGLVPIPRPVGQISNTAHTIPTTQTRQYIPHNPKFYGLYGY